MTWKGDWVNDTLVSMFVQKGFQAMNRGLYINVTDSGLDKVKEALREIAVEPPPNGEVLAENIKNKYLQKWDHLLPESLLNKNYASSELDVPGAIASANTILSESK